MRLTSRRELADCLKEDAESFKSQNCSWMKRFKYNLFSTPISEQKHIWAYIKHMSYVEYYGTLKKKSTIYLLPYLYHLSRLRKESHITGFQIPPGTCGKGLTVYHRGTIIINPKTVIGDFCTLNAGVLIRHKEEGLQAPRIGENVFIGSGANIIGDIRIGDNVVIAPNSVVTKDISDGVIIGGINKILK